MLFLGKAEGSPFTAENCLRGSRGKPTSGGNLLQCQLLSECDYLLRVLEFMAIILL